MTESLLQTLRDTHPTEFEGWDGFESQVTARNRLNHESLMVVLYNHTGTRMKIHRVFVIDPDSNITIGNGSLRKEFNRLYKES